MAYTPPEINFNIDNVHDLHRAMKLQDEAYFAWKKPDPALTKESNLRLPNGCRCLDCQERSKYKGVFYRNKQKDNHYNRRSY